MDMYHSAFPSKKKRMRREKKLAEREAYMLNSFQFVYTLYNFILSSFDMILKVLSIALWFIALCGHLLFQNQNGFVAMEDMK